MEMINIQIIYFNENILWNTQNEAQMASINKFELINNTFDKVRKLGILPPFIQLLPFLIKERERERGG